MTIRFHNTDQLTGALYQAINNWNEGVRRISDDRKLTFEIKHTSMAFNVSFEWIESWHRGAAPDFAREPKLGEFQFRMLKTEATPKNLEKYVDDALSLVPEGEPVFNKEAA